MFDIQVFDEEKKDGLEIAIKASGSLVFASSIKLADSKFLSDKARANVLEYFIERSKSSKTDFDLHHLDTILVTTGWNKNTDIFDGVETWNARKTPEHKPINYEHDCSQIIGHMTDCSTIDEDGKILVGDLTNDTLPAKFHILTGAVLYKYWDKPELQTRIDTVLKEIAENKWCVSMECLFKGFDYGLKDESNVTKIVARNDQTAFLSKHLKQYGGAGKYENYTIGRVLRNIVFSGKGLVKNPANPESIILQACDGFGGTKAVVVEDFSKLVYSNSCIKINEESKQKMANELETEIASLKTSLELANKAKTDADKLLVNAADELKKLQASITEKDNSIVELTKSLTDTKDELGKLYQEQTKATRKSLVKDKLKFTDEVAEKFVVANILVKDIDFTSQVELLAANLVLVKVGVSDVVVTPKVEPVVEVDNKGEQIVAKVNLDTAQTTAAVALATSVDDSGVNKVQTDIHNYLKGNI